MISLKCNVFCFCIKNLYTEEIIFKKFNFNSNNLNKVQFPRIEFTGSEYPHALVCLIEIVNSPRRPLRFCKLHVCMYMGVMVHLVNPQRARKYQQTLGGLPMNMPGRQDMRRRVSHTLSSLTLRV